MTRCPFKNPSGFLLFWFASDSDKSFTHIALCQLKWLILTIINDKLLTAYFSAKDYHHHYHYSMSCLEWRLLSFWRYQMEFFSSAVTVLQTLVVAIGAGLGVWGIVNLLEGYGNDNPGAKSQGIKQLMAGGGVALIGTTLVPLLSGLFG